MTLRELRWAAEAAWEPQAEMLAMTANCNRDTKKRPQPFAGHEFNPYAESRPSSGRTIPITAANIRMLKQVFCKGRNNGKPGLVKR